MNEAMAKSLEAPAETGLALPFKRKIAAILAADVAGYSRLVAEDEERTLRDLAAAREIFDTLVSNGGGRIFNTAGDSVMCEFDSAVEAVRVAVDIQNELGARNRTVPRPKRLEFRMGLTIGDVVDRNGDLLGDGVNIAARLEGMAPPGGICVSRSVHEAVANKLSVQFRELGMRRVKNIPQPVHAYLIAPAEDPGEAIEPVAARPSVTSGSVERRTQGRWPVVAGGLAVLAVAAGLFAGRPAVEWLRGTSGQPVRTSQVDGQMAGGSVATPVEPVPATPSAPPTNQNTTPQPAPAPRPARPAPAAEAPSPVRPIKPAPQQAAKPEAPPAPKAEPRRDLPADPAAAFAALAREDIVGDPKTLAELYHNARVLETRGDKPAALAAFAAAAPLAGPYLDPLLRYGALLRAVRGQAAARQSFVALQRSNPGDAPSLLVALSTETDERRGKLETYVGDHPDDRVAAYFLAEALMERGDGGPTLTEKRLAFDDYDSFLDAAAAGDLNGRFIDRSLLDGWVETARRRRQEIETSFSSGPGRPSATFSRNPDGWTARLALPEPASAVAVRIGERGEVLPARLGDGRGARNAAEIDLPPSAARATLYVSYTDKAGREAGPFPLSFDPASATQDGSRAALERYPDSWVQFRADLPDLLSYAGLVSNRCAISRAAIGFGDDPPRQPLPLPPCDATGPAAMPSSASLVRLPEGTDSVQVQLTFADGSESQVRTFRRP